MKKQTPPESVESERVQQSSEEKGKLTDFKPHPADPNKQQAGIFAAPVATPGIPPPIKSMVQKEQAPKQLQEREGKEQTVIKGANLSPEVKSSDNLRTQGAIPAIKLPDSRPQPNPAARLSSQQAAVPKAVQAGAVTSGGAPQSKTIETRPADAAAAGQAASPVKLSSTVDQKGADVSAPEQSASTATAPQIPQHDAVLQAHAGAILAEGEHKLSLPPPPTAATNRAMTTGKGNVSLNFDDADIYSVIQTVFGEILKYNYIIDARVKGRVTFRSVAPVPKEKVLPLMEVILRLNGVAIIEESELYRIIPISDLSREPSEIKIGRKIIETDLKGKAVLQVVPLNYVQSSEIVKLISPFVSANAVVVDVPKANHIILADTDANVKRILHLIEYFDIEMKEKKGVRVFVHHVQNATAKDVVTMLQQIYLSDKKSSSDRIAKTPSGVPPASQPAQPVMVSTQTAGTDAVVSESVKIFADEKLNAVVILGTREDYDIIRETIKELDLIPRQVLIEGIIASIQLTDKLSLGMAWAIKNKFLNFEWFDISFNPSVLNTTKSIGASGSGLNLIGIDDLGAVRLFINALASQSKAKLLASPHIMVADNNEARIQVGQQVPIPTSEIYGTSTSATTVGTQRTIQYKDIGIILKVKPLINDSGYITLQISQEVSTYSTIKLYAGEDQIILNKTEATTKLVVKDGHTIVIGGLMREDDNKARAGLPWLSKIPVLGYLFGNTDTDKNRTELVILLTPYIVKDEKDAKAVRDAFVGKIKEDAIIDGLENKINDKAKKGSEEKRENKNHEPGGRENQK